MKKNKYIVQKKKWYNKITLGKIIVLAPFAFLFYCIIVVPIACQILKRNGTKTKAIITPYTGEYYKGTKWYLHYHFYYGGKQYIGNSLIPQENKDVVGDSIDVLFFEFWPSFNCPVSYFEE